ncbi:MAG: hypothetical protein GY855_11845 [candidate division Zixibacteria bacterium]|nr:hypothetical protein [candidate division Zixibacteria bacterium]
MRINIIKFSILLAVISVLLISCGSKKTITAPKASGQITVKNESGIPILIEKYKHTRGDQSKSREINLQLRYHGSRYTFTNLIDGVNTKYFRGGDKVVIQYEALEDQPGNPGVPLFSGSFNVEINGNASFKFTSGGNIQEQ